MNVQETEWYQTRPPAVQRRIDEYPPTHLYRMKQSGQFVVLYAYEQQATDRCETCKVRVLRRYNPHTSMERIVFGVPFSDLEDTGEDAR